MLKLDDYVIILFKCLLNYYNNKKLNLVKEGNKVNNYKYRF